MPLLMGLPKIAIDLYNVGSIPPSLIQETGAYILLEDSNYLLLE